MKKSKGIYLNYKQLAFINATQKDRTWIGGRGTGKSYCIGASLRQKMGDLPRAKGFLSSTTYGQILTKTLPPIEEFWKSCGLKEWKSAADQGHYVVGRQPPRHWINPYSVPRKFQNVITFQNGFTIELLSMDRADLARGGSFDFGEIDEALLVPQDHLNKVLIPAIRGRRHKFTHWSHHQLSKYTSRPWKAEGMYLNDYEDKAKAHPNDYYYLESTAYDNIEVLGEDSIKRMKLELDYLVFEIEIMNKKSGRATHGFYPKFDDSYHTYSPSYLYGEGERGITVLGTSDRDRNAPLDLSFDFGGHFKCVTVWQEDGAYEYMRDAIHKSKTGTTMDLVDEICMRYADQQNRYVRIWGEPRGHDTYEGSTMYQKIKSRFLANGWNPDIKAPAGKTEYHEIRYEFVNEVFSEETAKYPKVRINEVACKDVIIALNNTEVKHDNKKDKKNEANKSFNQAHATHYPDTLDYYLIQKHGWKANMNMMSGRGSNRVS
jgi:hypothetical protein